MHHRAPMSLTARPFRAVSWAAGWVTAALLVAACAGPDVTPLSVASEEPASTPTPSTPTTSTTPTTSGAPTATASTAATPTLTRGPETTDVKVFVHTPVFDAPGASFPIVLTAAGARGFEVALGDEDGVCAGEMWQHTGGTSQECWVSLPPEPGEHRITARALLGDAHAVGVETVEAVGPVDAGLDPAARASIQRCGNTSEQVWLTFDDGFLSDATMTSMLDTLDRENVQALFFATGQWSRHNPRMTAALVGAGHRVENHTDTHEKLSTLGDDALTAQVAGGPSTDATLLRPGYGAGAFTARVGDAAQRHGQSVCYWTVDPRDWDRPSADELVRRVIDGDRRTPPVRPGGVVLLHMTGAHTAAALPDLIREIRGAGMELPPLR